MILAIASRADWQGPSGFSLESIMTASLDIGWCGRAAAASMGSVKIWLAAAAADSCKKERREKGETLRVGMENLRFIRRDKAKWFLAEAKEAHHKMPSRN